LPAVSPAVAHHRARIAALSRDRQPDDLELADAKRDLAAANIERYVEKTLAAAPELREDQRARLAELLRPVR
jgi:hypothetical protein